MSAKKRAQQNSDEDAPVKFHDDFADRHLEDRTHKFSQSATLAAAARYYEGQHHSDVEDEKVVDTVFSHCDTSADKFGHIPLGGVVELTPFSPDKAEAVKTELSDKKVALEIIGARIAEKDRKLAEFRIKVTNIAGRLRSARTDREVLLEERDRRERTGEDCTDVDEELRLKDETEKKCESRLEALTRRMAEFREQHLQAQSEYRDMQLAYRAETEEHFHNAHSSVDGAIQRQMELLKQLESHPDNEFAVSDVRSQLNDIAVAYSRIHDPLHTGEHSFMRSIETPLTGTMGDTFLGDEDGSPFDLVNSLIPDMHRTVEVLRQSNAALAERNQSLEMENAELRRSQLDAEIVRAASRHPVAAAPATAPPTPAPPVAERGNGLTLSVLDTGFNRHPSPVPPSPGRRKGKAEAAAVDEKHPKKGCCRGCLEFSFATLILLLLLAIFVVVLRLADASPARRVVLT